MKKNNLLLIGFAVSAATIFFSSSCVNNKKEVLFGCDSLNVSYSTTIKPILQNNCYSCHSSANATTLGGGIVLDNYTNLVFWVDITSGSDGGILLQNIKHTGNPMPKPPAAKLSVCDIAKVANWISEGAKNN